LPGRSFPAQVTDTGGAIDPVSRSLLVELQIPNETNELLSGAYGVVNLKLTGASNILTVPANTLLFRREGPALGVVRADGKVEIAPITINGNQGDRLEISKGLSGSEQVILDPSDGLISGMAVKINAPNTPAHKPEASTAK
jgi:multidrug efflux pump subunit AcrA (membrane-fusion protein)